MNIFNLFKTKPVELPKVNNSTELEKSLATYKADNERIRSELTALEARLDDLKNTSKQNRIEVFKRRKLIENMTQLTLAEVGIQKVYANE
jgi:predicted  nucleic acid-binding Zn-ribbon protein